MKLCWLLGVLTAVHCKDNDATEERKVAAFKVASEANRTTVDPQGPLAGNNRTLAKRQTGPSANKVVPIDGLDSPGSVDTPWSTKQQPFVVPPQKRVKFASWGGKRGPEYSKENTRPRFSSWAGKRTAEINIDPFKNYSENPKFSLWTDKNEDQSDLDNTRKLLADRLASYTQELSEGFDSLENDKSTQDGVLNEEKRTKFSSWGGKRSDNSYNNKRKFYSWAGKRSINQIPYFNLMNQLYYITRHGLGQNMLNSNVKGNLLNDESPGGHEINSNNNGDLGTTELSSSNDITGSWPDFDWKSSTDKRTKFSSWGGKRKFSSWGGKRSEPYDILSLLDEISTEEDGDKSKWIGKRELLEKPSDKTQIDENFGKFPRWEGILSDNYLSNYIDDNIRERFSSWGGKRALGEPSTWYDDKRTKFMSLGGEPFDEESEYFDTDKRDSNWAGIKKKIKGRGFSSWGGKRSYSGNEDIDSDKQFDFDTNGSNDIKRATKFSSWGGKRSQDIEEEKRKFSSWGGKRSQDMEEEKRKFSSWGGKRSQDMEKEKRKFSSWGGKRSQDIEEEKRKFSSWGGKRSQDIEDDKRKFSYGGGDFESFEEPKIAKFLSWATKRSVSPNESPDIDKMKEIYKIWSGKEYTNTLNNTEPTKLQDVNFNQSDDSLTNNKFKRGFSNYYKQFEMIKRNPLLRAWIGRNYPERNLITWKRRPAFSSWGGKRSLTQETIGEMPQMGNTMDEEKRERFSSWGGKRHALDKRSAQKTAGQILKKLSPNKKNSRSPKILGTRAALESHFYLRSSKDGLLTPAIRPIRRQFYAWGGKRASQS